MILKSISKKEFNRESSDTLKIKFSESLRAYYRLNTNSTKILFACSSDIVKPVLLTFNGYIFIGIDLRVFVIGTNEIIQEVKLTTHFIDFIQTKKQIILISELEFLIIDKSNLMNIESERSFDDVVIEYKLLNQSTISISLQNGNSFDLEI